MKKTIKKAMLFIAACTLTMMFFACSSDDNDTTDPKNGDTPKTESESSKEAAMTAIKQYVEQVVFPTYTSLANESKKLTDGLVLVRDKMKANILTDEDLKAVGESFLKARAYWEKSEAFLYGPATTFGIDPHIDSWPLDVEVLARDLNNPSLLERLEEVGASELAPTLLGFHAIEFILYRNGQLRNVDQLKGNEMDEAFNSVTINGMQELIYAAAVAEDLMQKCFQLQVAWMGKKAEDDRVVLVEEEWEQETRVADDYYGDNMLNAGQSGSTYKTWQDAIVTIISAGCSNICNEVANTKIGNAWSGDDPNYIESPYSKKSFVDFYDNIMSIKNSLYGGINLDVPAENSLMTLLTNSNQEMATQLTAKLKAALEALHVCTQGEAFVDIIASGQKPAQVSKAIDAINALDDQLHEVEKWAAEME